MSNTDKTFTIKINSDLGTSVESLNKVEQAVHGIGATLKDVTTITSTFISKIDGTSKTVHEHIARLTSTTTQGINEAKAAINSISAAGTQARTVLASAATEETNRLRQLAATEKEVAAQRKAFQDQRNQIFSQGLSEAQAKLRADIGIQKAIQQEGAQSITAIKLRQAEQERQIAVKLSADLEAINRRYQNEYITRSQASAQRNVLLNNSRGQILQLNQASVEQINSINRVRTAMQEQERAAHSLDFSFTGLITRAAEFIGIYRVLNLAINTVVNSIKAIPQIEIQKEATLASLGASLTSLKDITSSVATGSVFKALTEEAKRTGIEIQTLRENFRTFQASASLAGESLQDVWKMFTNINSVSTALHLSNDKVQLTFLALSQIFNKTKVQSEELVKQLGNLLPGAFSSFVQANKKTVDGAVETTQQASLRIVSEMKKGNVAAHETILNFTNFYAQRFAGAFDAASVGLNANIGRMKNSFVQLGEAIASSTTGPMIGFTKGVSNAVDWIRIAITDTGTLGKTVDTFFTFTLAGGITILANLIGRIPLLQSAIVGLGNGISLAVTQIATINSAATAAAAGMNILKASFAFLASPGVIVAGIALIGLKLHELRSERETIIADIDASFQKLKDTKSAKSPEQQLELKVKYDVDVVGAKKQLENIARLQKEHTENTIGASLAAEEYDKRGLQLILAKDKAEKVYSETVKRRREQLKLEIDDDSKRAKEAADASKALHEGGDTGKAAAKAAKQQAAADAKLAKDEIADLIRDGKNAADSIRVQITEITDQAKEALANAEKGTYTEQLAALKIFYDKKIALIEQETAVQLDALYKAKEIARQRHDIAKQQQIDDEIIALGGKPPEKGQPGIHGSADKEEIAAKKELRALQKQIDDDEKQAKQQLIGVTATADETFKANLVQLDALYNSLDSKGNKILTNAEYAAGLNKLNTDFNKGKDKEVTKSIESGIPALDRYNEHIKKVNSSTKDLGNITNATYNAALKGVNLLVGTLEKLNTGTKEITNSIKDENDKYAQALDGINNSKYTDKTQKEKDMQALKVAHVEQLRKLEQDSIEASLDGTRQLIASAQLMFNKKSSGYKALGQLQESIAIAQGAMQAVQLAKTLAGLPVKIASGVAELFAEGGWAGFAGAAAFIALIAAIGVNSGTSKSSGPKPTVSPTTGSVLGDPGKQSDSLANVVSVLKDIHVKEYKELQGINDGVTLMSKGINNVLTRAYQVPGAGSGVYDPAGISTVTKNGGGLALPSNSEPANKLLTNLLFGGKITKSVVAGGITTASTEMSEILAGSLVGAAQYSIVETTKKGGLFTKTKKSIDTIFTQIDSGIQESLTDIYRSVGTTLISLSDTLGLNLGDAIKKTVIPSLTVNLRGMSSEDASKALNAAVSTLIDNLSTNLFGKIAEQYQKLGEGMFETVSRLAIDVGVVRNSFNLIGLTFKDTGVDAISFSEALVSASGTIQDLRTSFENFFSSFLTKQEQEQYNYETLSTTLSDMNIVLPTTRDGWKILVQTMLAGGNATATTAANLLSLTKNADSYYKTIEASQSALISGLFGTIADAGQTMLANTAKQQAIINSNSVFKDVGLTAGATTEVLQQEIASYMKASGVTMQQILEYLKSTPELRAALDSFVALAASNTSTNTSDSKVKELNPDAKTLVDKFSANFSALITRLTATLAAAMSPTTPVSLIQNAVDSARDAYNTAVADLNNLYSTITSNLQKKMFELKDAIQKINISLIKGDAQRAAAETSLYIEQKKRIYAELNKTVSGESAQATYDRQITSINELQSLIQARYDNEVSRIKEITSALDSIRTHVKELLIDANLSPLTNAQRLGESSKQFQDILALAKTGDKDALGKVNSALDAYLNEARGFYASSTDYQKIFYEATAQANALTAGMQTTDEQIAKATASTVSELQSLQNTLSSIEAKKASELAGYQAQLTQNFNTLGMQFLQGIQEMVNAVLPGNSIDIGSSFGGNSTNGGVGAGRIPAGSNGTISDANFAIQLKHFDDLMNQHKYLDAAKYAISAGYTKPDISSYVESKYHIPYQDTYNFLTDNGFAKGGAFTNGVVQRPTMFNMAQMGENGSEAILPLANIGGKLGVHANSGVSEELILELKALRAEVAKFREERMQSTGDLIMSNYDAHSKTAVAIGKDAEDLLLKEQWLEKSKPVLI